MIRVLLASRSVPALLAVTAALAALSWALGRNAIVIDMSAFERDNRLPYPELCGVVTAVLATALTRPRFWEWDRVGSRRPAVVAGVSAAVATGLPMLVMAVGATRVPEGVPWSWSAANVLVYSALVVGLAPFLGVGAAGGSVLVAYFAVGVLNNLEPAVGAVLPVTAYPGPDGEWPAGVALAVLAVVAHAWTRGSTAWAHRSNP